MRTKISRRSALATLTGGAALVSTASLSNLHAAADAQSQGKLKGNIRHSVCRWCYGRIQLEDLCRAAKEIGLESVELQGPAEWPTLRKFGLTCAMASNPTIDGLGTIERAFNRVEHHDKLVQAYERRIKEVAEAGLENLICFSGNRAGLDDEKGIENCAIGLKRIMKTAEKHKVNIVMELLNSKVNHQDYQCDKTPWGVELCKQIGSDRFKLLYDIYHMQIMEGDVIRTIRDNAPYIAHYHTGGVPGRNEIDETQELYYPAIMQAILETGYKGHVGQEFIPKRPDALDSLKQGVLICDV
jgi:hydroxypyruvate isomerase